MRWLPVLGFEGLYEVSEYGDCRRLGSTPRVKITRDLKPRIDRKGYAYYRLCNGVTQVRRKAHRMVLEAFIGPGDGMFGLHTDDNPANNHLSNLRWGTPAENMADRQRNNPYWNNGRQGRTHCRKGHEYTPDNTRIRHSNRTGRDYRECLRAAKRRSYARSVAR